MMMKQMSAMAGLFMLLAACGSQTGKEKTARKEITIKGSETELTMVQQLGNAFLAGNKDVKLRLSGGGSEEGIRLMINGSVDIANASRQISPEEMDRARHNRVTPVPVIFAVDVIAVITHPKLGVDSLSVSQLGAIFSGKAGNWKMFNGPDAPIHLYGRDIQSGTHHYFKQKVLHEGYAPGMSLHPNYSEIIERVRNDPYGIGYVSLAHLAKEGKPHKNTWAVYLYVDGGRACSPYEARWVREGQYPLIRPLYQYTNGVPANDIQRFIDFELSPKGQAIIARTGFFPINDFHRQINRKEGYKQDGRSQNHEDPLQDKP